MRPLLICLSLFFFSFTPSKVAVLYRGLNPNSVSEHLAFYKLFPETSEGKQALHDAWQLLSGGTSFSTPLTNIPESSLNAIVTLITKAEGVETISLPASDLKTIEKLAERLPNRQLKGHFARSEAEVLLLSSDEIDLSQALLLAQAAENPALLSKMDSYNALMDLMALQILTKVTLNDPPEKKIRELNRFIFEEMGYRFPPHSAYAKDIDIYTYLPSVIDSRRGVCLGVSILYLCLSQRLNLPLEAVTPPGHIYVRYRNPDKTINIETTARGIHLDSKEYLGIETEELPLHPIKEVVGLAYFNEASVHWQNENYIRALQCYQKASHYLPNDPLLKEFIGLNYLFIGEIEKGRELLSKLSGKYPGPVSQQNVIEDFLQGHVDSEGIRTLFMHVDEKRESLLKKKQIIQKALVKWPNFRAGYFHLAVTWLQLHRYGEALQALEEYEKREKQDPTAEYLLAQLYAIRSEYPKAWVHLHRAEELIKGRQPMPETLKELHRELARHSPE